MRVRTVSGFLEAVRRVMVGCENFDVVIASLEAECCIHHQSLCTACSTNMGTHRESIWARGTEEVARYALGQRGAVFSMGDYVPMPRSG